MGSRREWLPHLGAHPRFVGTQGQQPGAQPLRRERHFVQPPRETGDCPVPQHIQGQSDKARTTSPPGPVEVQEAR